MCLKKKRKREARERKEAAAASTPQMHTHGEVSATRDEGASAWEKGVDPAGEDDQQAVKRSRVACRPSQLRL